MARSQRPVLPTDLGNGGLVGGELGDEEQELNRDGEIL